MDNITAKFQNRYIEFIQEQGVKEMPVVDTQNRAQYTQAYF